jgi:hypothetical protein
MTNTCNDETQVPQGTFVINHAATDLQWDFHFVQL